MHPHDTTGAECDFLGCGCGVVVPLVWHLRRQELAMSSFEAPLRETLRGWRRTFAVERSAP